MFWGPEGPKFYGVQVLRPRLTWSHPGVGILYTFTKKKQDGILGSQRIPEGHIKQNIRIPDDISGIPMEINGSLAISKGVIGDS